MPNANTQAPSPIRTWLRFWFRIAIVTFTMLLIAWVVWAWIAHRRLQQAIEAIRARGEPLEMADLKIPLVADSENAAIYWKKAALAFVPSAIGPTQRSHYEPFPPYSAAWQQWAQVDIATNSQAILLARQASQYSRADWNEPKTFPAITTQASWYGPLNFLSSLMCDAAIYSHIQGDDAEAVARCLNVLSESDTLAQSDRFASYVNSVAAYSNIGEPIEIIASQLQIEGARFPYRFSTANKPHPATREQINRLIARLLDEKINREIRQHGVDVLRAYDYEIWRGVKREIFIIQPMLDLELIRSLEDRDVERDAMLKDDWNSMNNALLGEHRITSDMYSFMGGTAPAGQNAFPSNYSRILVPIFNYNVSYWLTYDYQFKGRARAAAISLAIHLYRTDKGRWPANLDELVPEYLPKVPRDIFQPGNVPMGYTIQKMPNGIDRPLIYFEPTGTPTSNSSPPTKPAFGYQPWKTRQWHDVSLEWYTLPTSATQSTFTTQSTSTTQPDMN